jgi:DNA-binding transcriptional LysR family regulator
VTAAGKQLGVRQPTMSGDLRHLREFFGDELLVPMGGQYQLTALATRLLEPLTSVLAAIDQTLLLRPSFDPRTETYDFSISMADYALPLLLKPLGEVLAREAPNVSVHFHNPAQRMLKLSRGDVDLVISPTNDPSAASYPGMRSEPLYHDRWVCVVDAANSRVANRMTAKLFSSLRHLEIGVGAPRIANSGEQAYRAADLPARVPISSESYALTPMLLAGTELVAVVPEKVARHFAGMGGLKILQPPFPTEPQVQTMYWNPLTDANPPHAWLRDVLHKIARGLDA